MAEIGQEAGRQQVEAADQPHWDAVRREGEHLEFAVAELRRHVVDGLDSEGCVAWMKLMDAGHDLTALGSNASTWVRSGRYHTIISGDGRLTRLHTYCVVLPAPAYRRNSNSASLSCACMDGQPDLWLIPPTEPPL